MEEATLIKRMRSAAGSEPQARKADGLGVRLGVLEREAAQVCAWLQTTSDLVEPEPATFGDRTS